MFAQFGVWTACADALPTKSGDYITTNMEFEHPFVSVHRFSVVHQVWNEWDGATSEEVAESEAKGRHLHVTHWMPRPALPVRVQEVHHAPMA